jgi:hypothetical protein
MRRPLLAAAALVLVVNAWILAGVALNRAGEPEARLVLRERELVVTGGAAADENSGVGVRLEVNRWRPGSGSLEAWQNYGSLTGARLASLGFDLTPPRDLDEALRLARRQPARRAFAVLQLGGSAWEAWLGALDEAVEAGVKELAAGTIPQRELTRRREHAEAQRRQGTRLFLVDAGADPEALRAAWPDRTAFLILPAEVSLQVAQLGTARPCEPDGCRLVGRINLLVDEVAIPRRLQASLPPGPRGARRESGRGDEAGPPFELVLCTGRRREPWVESIRPLAAGR